MIGAVLDWVAGEGFEEFFGRFRPEGFEFTDAAQLRNRHLISAMNKRTPR